MKDLNVALELLAVGMITVFIILSLVFLLGRLIIILVNRFFPELGKPLVTKVTSAISPKKLAVLTAVVHKITHGKGHVSHVEKLKK